MEPARISQEHVKELFNVFDADGGGSIEPDELAQAFISLGICSSTEEVDALVRQIDADGDGTIDFEEFTLVIEKLISQRDSVEEMHKAFLYFSDGKEIITLNDLRQVSIDTNDVRKEQFLSEMWLIGDTNNDGVITFRDFRVLMERAIATEKEGITSPDMVFSAANKRDGVKL